MPIKTKGGSRHAVRWMLGSPPRGLVCALNSARPLPTRVRSSRTSDEAELVWLSPARRSRSARLLRRMKSAGARHGRVGAAPQLGPATLRHSWERAVNGSAPHAREEAQVFLRDNSTTATATFIVQLRAWPRARRGWHTVSNLRGVTGGGGSAPRVLVSERACVTATLASPTV